MIGIILDQCFISRGGGGYRTDFVEYKTEIFLQFQCQPSALFQMLNPQNDKSWKYMQHLKVFLEGIMVRLIRESAPY